MVVLHCEHDAIGLAVIIFALLRCTGPDDGGRARDAGEQPPGAAPVGVAGAARQGAAGADVDQPP